MFYTIDNIRGFSGYSKAVRELALAMSKKTFVKCIDFTPTGYLPEAIQPLILGGMPELRETDVVFGRCYFTDLLKLKPEARKGPRLIANLALECDKFPESIIRDCNDDRIEQIWVPSTFVRDNLVDNLVIEEKIKVVPHGYDPEVYNVKPVIYKDYYRFMFNGGYTGKGDRKGADLLVESFKEEFKKEIEEQKVMLYLKLNTTYGDASKDLEGAGIVIDKNFYSEKDLSELLSKADCYVCPSSGEAFDMGTLEAMACGLPIIHNTWGGQRDYMSFLQKDVSRRCLLESDVVPAKFSPWDIGMWRRPRVSSIMMEMRYMYEHKPTVVKYDDIEDWTWDKAAEVAIKWVDQ
jgi:glycosyltransferase involved in cell wall biosynthesis